jgi:hypothetical protein
MLFESEKQSDEVLMQYYTSLEYRDMVIFGNQIIFSALDQTLQIMNQLLQQNKNQ